MLFFGKELMFQKILYIYFLWDLGDPLLAQLKKRLCSTLAPRLSFRTRLNKIHSALQNILIIFKAIRINTRTEKFIVEEFS